MSRLILPVRGRRNLLLPTPSDIQWTWDENGDPHPAQQYQRCDTLVATGGSGKYTYKWERDSVNEITQVWAQDPIRLTWGWVSLNDNSDEAIGDSIVDRVTTATADGKTTATLYVKNYRRMVDKQWVAIRQQSGKTVAANCAKLIGGFNITSYTNSVGDPFNGSNDRFTLDVTGMGVDTGIDQPTPNLEIAVDEIPNPWFSRPVAVPASRTDLESWAKWKVTVTDQIYKSTVSAFLTVKSIYAHS